MSNTMVGSVYQKIMDEVIENCVVTFEEDGVERKLLDEVKKTWQTKLSERKVALMPWDPAPVAGGGAASQSSGSASARAQQQQQQQQLQLQQQQQQQQQQQAAEQAAAAAAAASAAAAAAAAQNGASVKAEPQGNYDLQNLPRANGAAGAGAYNQGAAYERASQNLHDRFGEAATPQISQLQARKAMSGGAAGSGSGSGAQQQQQQQVSPEQRQKMMIQRPGAVGSGQTDGAADWDAYVAERRAAHAQHGAQADASLLEMMRARAVEMEAGGVFERVPRKGKAKARAVAGERREGGGRFDGVDGDEDMEAKEEDEEEDEDAINSELDDSADEQPEDDDEDGDRGEIMLCTYDKVQRVKNKWKCTLKDGVLTTGGKEYVFHKAQGEFEW